MTRGGGNIYNNFTKNKRGGEFRMFSRKLLTIGAPILGMVAIVGSGFSAWHFQAEVSAEKNLNVELTPIADYGDIVFADSDYYVVLDQGGYANLSDETKGIRVETTSGADRVSVTDIEIDYFIETEKYNELVGDGYNQLNVSTYICVKEALAEYVGVTASNFVSTSLTESTFNGYTVYVRTQQNLTLGDTTIDPASTPAKTVSGDALDIDVSTTGLVNAGFQYVADAKPENETEWNSLSEAITSAGEGAIKVVCVASWVAGN